jgi:hypothetical protein
MMLITYSTVGCGGAARHWTNVHHRFGGGWGMQTPRLLDMTQRDDLGREEEALARGLGSAA